jgi:hypothetical protein
MRFVVDNRERKDAFMEMMKDAVGDLIQETTGVRPSWPKGPQSAPESERGGHA